MKESPARQLRAPSRVALDNVAVSLLFFSAYPNEIRASNGARRRPLRPPRSLASRRT